MPPFGSPSWPTRFTAQTYTPLAIAWLRWIVSQAALLLGAVLGLLRRQPSDGGGVEQDLGAAQRGEPRRLRIPLVPADQHADPAEPRVPAAETEVAGREVELLVVLRIVGNVHLPVLAEIPAVGVDDGGGVVIQPLGALLEERRDDHDAELGRERGERLGGRAGDRLGQIEEPMVLHLAEVLATEELLQADDLRAARGGIADALHGLLHVDVGFDIAVMLYQAERHRALRGIGHAGKIIPR